ncbi:aspartyl protease [Candidatus Poribacteria bacterium]|nr:MAG: aspartyl protease [Candidatus Poribacteria bacterium]
MRHTTEIKLANLADLILAKEGVIPTEEVRSITVEDALVDTGASRLSLPKPIIEQLGLIPVGRLPSKTANGTVMRTVYSGVEFTIMERSDIIQVTDLPKDAPVLVGHIILEKLDICLHIEKGLIYNPDHGNEWIDEAW